MENKKASPIIFVCNNPSISNNDIFFNTLNQLIGGLPIDIYVYDTADFFKVKGLLEKEPQACLIYEKCEYMYDNISLINYRTYNQWSINSSEYCPLSISKAYDLILCEAARSFKIANYNDCVKDVQKIYQELFNEQLSL